MNNYENRLIFGKVKGVQKQESSAKLTNQRISYAFTSSPLSFHARHILPSSKFQHSYSRILLIFYRHQWIACVKTVLWVWILALLNTVHWFDASSSVTPMITPHNNYITSTVIGIHFCCRWKYMRSSANFRTVFSESQNANPLDAKPETDFNAKWPFNVIEGHPFRCQWRSTEGPHSTMPWMWRFGRYGERKKQTSHLRRPHSHFTPPLQQTPANIHINLMLL